MRPYDIIQKKRDGKELSREEINFLVQGYTAGEIPDYQMSAWAMAVYFKGMTDREITDLTLAMANSGERIDLSAIEGIKVDKHSTGGVADTVTLVVAPMVAAAGVPVAKMSGRGLGHTGGTIDKLEAVPGFHVGLTREGFIQQVNRIKLAVIGQTDDLAPADKKLYALRDVTATVGSIPLIASSVMAKKIAAGADAIVLDVKTGSGAFMKDEKEAMVLARTMVGIGKMAGRRTVAVVSDMDQPLGNAIGNALEVEEAIRILRGEIREGALLEVSLAVGARMLLLAGKASTAGEGKQILLDILQSGRALAKLREFLEAQGGDGRVTDDLALLPHASFRHPVKAPAKGYVQKIQSEQAGLAAMMLGAGRARKEDSIDLAVGIVLHKKVGDPVEAGEPFAVIHANDMEKAAEAEKMLLAAYAFGPEKPQPRPLIHGIVE